MTQTPTPPAAVDKAAGQPDVTFPLGHLPPRDDCPAIPYSATKSGTPNNLHANMVALGLGVRGGKAREDGTDVYDILKSKTCTIADQTHSAYEFLYPPQSGQWTPANELPLNKPEQFTLLWTPKVLDAFGDLVPPFCDLLTCPTAATTSFWPMIANFGLPYNLLVLTKVDPQRCATLATTFGDAWASKEMDALQAAGLLYEIDMTMMALKETTHPHPGSPNSDVRFTPGTLTVLTQDPASKALTPVLIQVSANDKRTQTYRPTDKAWLYALQAAKTSITVYGIWLGHVYHWHIVTAALQMTMYNVLPPAHPLRPLLEHQSEYLIDFDYVLLKKIWDRIAPPTPLDGDTPLVDLLSTFGKDRGLFDDDPPTALKARGIDPADFTVAAGKPWGAYPMVGFLLDIWKITSDFVTAVVDSLYPHDSDVANDGDLTAWVKASGDPAQGNVRGLPEMNTRADLIAVLTSLLYRVTAHGAASLRPAVHPALSFVANFPPCLQSTDVPDPSTTMSTEELLARLPHTGTLGGMTTFYYTFAYTPPDVPLIPPGGINADLYFPASQAPCNDALVAYRKAVCAFIDAYVAASDEALTRLWGHKPGTPSDPAALYDQWARSIEI
jgi:Lipoxygenase